MFDLKPLVRTPSRPRWPGPSATACSTSRGEAESICLDILPSIPENQAARITLLLALTDQFHEASGAHHGARDVLAGLTSEYDRAYYAGIIAERRAKAQFARAGVRRAPASTTG